MRIKLVIIFAIAFSNQLFGSGIELGNVIIANNTDYVCEVVVDCISTTSRVAYHRDGQPYEGLASIFINCTVVNSSCPLLNDTVTLEYQNEIEEDRIFFAMCSGVEFEMKIGEKYVCHVEKSIFTEQQLLIRAERGDYNQILKKFYGTKKVVDFLKKNYSTQSSLNSDRITSGLNKNEFYIFIDSLNTDNVMFYNLHSKKFTLLKRDCFFESEIIEFNLYVDNVYEYQNKCFVIKTKDGRFILNRDDLSVCIFIYPDEEFTAKRSVFITHVRKKNFFSRLF